MGRRGPVPMPDNVRALRGRTGHNEKVTQAVKPPPIAPNPPTWLSTEAKAEWKRIVPELEKLGVLARIDRAVLATYCSAWAKVKQAEAEIAVSGLTSYSAKDGVKKHPLWQIYREASTLVAALAKELYLTPVARLRVTKPEDGDGDETEGGIID